MRDIAEQAWGTGSARLAHVAELARQHLGVAVAYVSEFTGGQQVPRSIAGDATSFGLSVGVGVPLPETYCQRMLAGEIPSLIPDTAAVAGVAGLAATHDSRIAAYLAVPLRLSDGSLYGTLCALSHSPDHSLDERDVRFLALLADLLVEDLTAERDEQRRREQLVQLIAAKELQIACQPVIDLRDGRVIGLEALSRFPGGLRPDETFATAHRLGVGLELERLAIGQAFQLLPRLRPSQFLSLNLDPSVALTLAREFQVRRDLPLSQLVVEITEHAAIDSYLALLTQLDGPRQHGLRIAIDDAGAGYASLRHIVELRPDFIKIDRSLVDGVSADHARRVTVSSFVLLALDLGATVIAEGVENQADLETLADLGVDAVQGYLLAPPSTNPMHFEAWTYCEREPDSSTTRR